MAENDIYDSKSKYERFVKNYLEFGKKPENRTNRVRGSYKSKYFCQNKSNLKYFPVLFKFFGAKDLSYVRRIRLANTFKIICHASKKDLKDCDRDDVNAIITFMHGVNKSIKSKQDFIIDIKFIWKILLPEKDEKGRIDDKLVPYAVRHLSGKMDISKEKRRNDKITIEEFEKLIKAFNQDIRLQAFLTLAFESLGRPQEILYTRIRDVEIYDNYAKIWISEHGKEGTGFLQSIDSFPYVVNWYNKHPLKHNPDSFFFINLGDFGKYEQLKPVTINKHIRNKLKLLKINKRVTCYSFKRNGVTFRRLRGDSDATIQHTARWTSTKQLKTYDYSQHEDTFKIELVKRGLIKDKDYKQFETTTKKCIYCEHINGIADDACVNCKRPLDRKKIIAEVESKENEIKDLKKQMNELPQLINELISQKTEHLEEALRKKTKQSV